MGGTAVVCNAAAGAYCDFPLCFTDGALILLGQTVGSCVHVVSIVFWKGHGGDDAGLIMPFVSSKTSCVSLPVACRHAVLEGLGFDGGGVQNVQCRSFQDMLYAVADARFFGAANRSKWPRFGQKSVSLSTNFA
jgi:hypothetical protein